MGITRNNRHKRRATGGKKKPYRANRKYELGRQPTNTKIGERRTTTVRMRGGKMKVRAIRLDAGNFSWATEGIARKTRILGVSYNATSNELVRTNTLVKNAIIQIDATPFRAWYERHYGIKLNKRKRVVQKGKPAAPGKKGAAGKAPAKPAAGAGKKGAKQAAKAPAKPAAKKGAKEAAKDAGKKAAKAAAKPKVEKKPKEKKEGQKEYVVRSRRHKVDPKLKAVRIAYAKRYKLNPRKRAQVVHKYFVINAKIRKLQRIRAKAMKERATAVAAAKAAGQPIPKPLGFMSRKLLLQKKRLSRAQTVHRNRRLAPIDNHLHEQFLTGRLFACISSRPGQDGCADGYILEGKELDFYVKKMKK